jgi:hypothetical protein
MQSANGIILVLGSPQPKHLVTTDTKALIKTFFNDSLASGSSIPGKYSE